MPKRKNRVLFICRDRGYGNNNGYIGGCIGLYSSAKSIVNFLNSKNIEAKVILVTDSNEIDRHVSEYKPSHVVIHAIWVTPEKIEELLAINRHKKVNWQIRVHSKVPFIAMEGNAMDWIVKYANISKKHKNFKLSANSKEFQNDMERALDINFEYLPNVYFPDENESDYGNIKKEDYEKIRSYQSLSYKNVINIGCFGAIRPLKNTLIQGVAALAFGKEINKKINFHINSGRTEQSGDQVLKNIKAVFSSASSYGQLVEHGWSNHKEFLSTISQMDVGMQVSYSETYNIVAADFIYVGVPIVVSSEIDWLPWSAQCDPNNVKSMITSLRYHYSHNSWLLRCFYREYFNKYNDSAKDIWLSYLENN